MEIHHTGEVKIGGKYITNVQYANTTTLIIESEDEIKDCGIE